MCDLGPDELYNVLSYLDAPSIARASAVNKLFHFAAGFPTLWRRLLAADFNVTAPAATSSADSLQAESVDVEVLDGDAGSRLDTGGGLWVGAHVINPTRSAGADSARSGAPKDEITKRHRAEQLVRDNPGAVYRALVGGLRRDAAAAKEVESFVAEAKAARVWGWCLRGALDVIQYVVLLGAWLACVPVWLWLLLLKLEGSLGWSWWGVFAPIFFMLAIPVLSIIISAIALITERAVTRSSGRRDLRNPCFGVARGEGAAFGGTWWATRRVCAHSRARGFTCFSVAVSVVVVVCAGLIPLLLCLKLEQQVDMSWGAALAPVFALLIVTPLTTTAGLCHQCIIVAYKAFDSRSSHDETRQCAGLLVCPIAASAVPMLIPLALVAAKADGYNVPLKHAMATVWIWEALAGLGCCFPLVIYIGAFISRAPHVPRPQAVRTLLRQLCLFLGLGGLYMCILLPTAFAAVADDEGAAFPVRPVLLPLLVFFAVLGAFIYCVWLAFIFSTARSLYQPDIVNATSWGIALAEALRSCMPWCACPCPSGGLRAAAADAMAASGGSSSSGASWSPVFGADIWYAPRSVDNPRVPARVWTALGAGTGQDLLDQLSHGTLDRLQQAPAPRTDAPTGPRGSRHGFDTLQALRDARRARVYAAITAASSTGVRTGPRPGARIL